MKIDHNDPRLTAYALNELAESDRLAFETVLAGDPEARQEVERIQRAAGNLTQQLAAEPCPRLEPEQRDVIYEEVDVLGGRGSSRAAARREARPPGFQWWIGLLAGAAALVVGGVLLLPALSTSREKVRTLAVNTAPDPVRLESQGELREVAKQGDKDDSYKDAVTKTPLASQLAPPPAAAPATPVYFGTRDLNGPKRTEREPTSVRGTDESGGLMLGGANTYTKSTATPVLEHATTYTPGLVAGSGGGVTIGDTSVKNQAYLGHQATTFEGGGTYADATSRTREGRLNESGKPSTSGERGGFRQERDANAKWSESEAKEKVPFYGDIPATRRQIKPSAESSDESYQPVYDNPFYAVTDQPLSTFGLDVDTASYSNIRRFLLNNQLPPRDAVRIEEMLNYFSYDYPAPRGKEPFALYVEMGECPWNPAHQLALIGLKAKDVTARQQPPLNLVFLIDISGSMSAANKLPLIKQAFHLLVPQLDDRDRVSIVVYASNAHVALPSTRGDQHRRILSVIDELNADGSTNGGDGIQNAYAQASENFIKGGINRVILCTDGDFNVGIIDQNDLTRLIQDQAKSGVFLSVFGFGMGNLKDSTMQKLADKGNGQYAYLDDIDEARKVLVDQARSTIIPVAKDVKLQVEFNPAQVQAYRLIGYEKRQLAARDFNNDRKDAGDLGAGHTVTALYEIIPAGEAVGEPGVDPLKYQPAKNRPAVAGEWATVKLRYKNPDADKSQLLTAALKNTGLRWRTASDDFQFAAAVAAFGMILRDSGYKGEANLDLALELAAAGRGRDAKGYRTEFADLVKRAASAR